ncbi:serine/threonine-protein kinase [Hyalangium gracile]|uniref:serine/threonine-protein kinase n=1 Tax=Hyalangium gracile TaxID=394092 RepID=UPI001CCABC5B|nr:serine/threonine-protein kinase [Hyalangium gracile]
MSEDDKTHAPARKPPASPQTSGSQISPGAVLKDTYRIEAELGSGGMGTVYRATHIGLDKTMAVKVLSPRAISSPESLARFGREARVAGKVNHPAMTHVIDFGVEQGTPYIVMEYVDGIELAEYIERQGPMPPRQAVAVMRQIVSLLHAAHALGIVHRDLKPSNIKIVRAGPDDGQLFVKVLDFGIAKVIGDMAGQLTSEGMMVGTPAYMAPEQIAGKPIDGRTDLYSAGLIFHELLSGVRAFQGETIARILYAQVHEPPPPVALPLPDVLRQTLLKFYEKRPEDRFQDAAQADRALMACEEALRSFSGGVVVAPVPPQGDVSRAASATPESFSATMRRPESGSAQAEAPAEGVLSATMMRPESGASGGTPSPAVSPPPARPVTDRDLKPAPALLGTDRQPAPVIPAPMPPAAMPGGHPGPMPGRHPAANQRGKSSGTGKGCLIAVLIVGFLGCLGMTGLGFLAWLSNLSQENAQSSSFTNEHHTAHPHGDPPEEEGLAAFQAAAVGLSPGCYATELIMRADRHGSEHAGAWEIESGSAWKPVDCSSVRRKQPSREAMALMEQWPVQGELLQVELSPPKPDPDDAGSLLRTVRAYTRVSEGAH